MHFDNETGKGDHKHVAEQEVAYVFEVTGAIGCRFLG